MKNLQEIKKLFSILFLRGAAVGFKFLLLILLPKFITTQDYGTFSMIVVTITLLIFGFGIDFYNFSIREYITSSKSYFFKTFLSQLSLYTLTYVIGTGILFLLPLDWTRQYIGLIIALGISEHLNTEIYRLLIGFEKTTLANFLYFLRNASWCIVILALFYLGHDVSVDLILEFWLISNTISILAVLFIYYKEFLNIRFRISRNFIKKGLMVSIIFFTGTLLLKAVEYSNRYVVEMILGLNDAAIFNFYMNFAMMITVYINTIVISIQYPKLVKSKNDVEEFSRTYGIFKKDMRFHAVIIFFVSILGVQILLTYLNNPIFSEYFYISLPICLGAILMNYSLLYHFFIYSLNKDMDILKALVFPAIFSVVFTIIVTIAFKSLMAAAVGYLISCLVLYLFRYKYFRKTFVINEIKRL